MNQLKAIPTAYNGYSFRSRLEARWAVYFDTIGLKWEYEVEGYELSDGRRYLPDFVITTVDGDKYYCEVKPGNSNGDGKLEMLLHDLNDNPTDGHGCGKVLSGDPYEFIITNKNYPCPRCMQFEPGLKHPCPIDVGFIFCGSCDFNTPSGGGHEHEPEVHFGIKTYPDKGSTVLVNDDTNNRKYRSLIRRACKKARSARFEGV